MPNTIHMRRRIHAVNDLISVDYTNSAVQATSPALMLNFVQPSAGLMRWGNFQHGGQTAGALEQAFATFQPDEVGIHTVVMVAYEGGRWILVSGEPIVVAR